MICPRCGLELQLMTLVDVPVHECTQCHGVWFERGELEQTADQTAPDLAWMDFEMWKDQELFNVAESALACPADGQGMAAIHYGDTGVVVDHCVKCGGVWLDAGEFENLIHALKDEAAAMPASTYVKTALHEATELVTGDKSFASEWQDFATVLRLMEYRLLVENPRLNKLLVDFARLSPFK
jgi:Zn-finger nucleic acid-binding protein